MYFIEFSDKHLKDFYALLKTHTATVSMESDVSSGKQHTTSNHTFIIQQITCILRSSLISTTSKSKSAKRVGLPVFVSLLPDRFNWYQKEVQEAALGALSNLVFEKMEERL
jgi:hypothetical protein